MPPRFHGNISHRRRRRITQPNDRHNLLGPPRCMNTVCLHESESVGVSAPQPLARVRTRLHFTYFCQVTEVELKCNKGIPGSRRVPGL